MNYHQIIVAKLNFVKFQIKRKFDTTSPDRKEKKKNAIKRLLAPRGFCKFIATGIRDAI